MICPHCGKTIEEKNEVRFCTSCGNPLTHADIVNTSKYNPLSSAYTQNPSDKPDMHSQKWVTYGKSDPNKKPDNQWLTKRTWNIIMGITAILGFLPVIFLLGGFYIDTRENLNKGLKLVLITIAFVLWIGAVAGLIFLIILW